MFREEELFWCQKNVLAAFALMAPNLTDVTMR
jgi:hypothetical protein